MIPIFEHPAILPLLLALYLSASVAVFLLYGWDKAASMSGQWRTRESTLHILSLLGGWPGALLAQRVFRHKSRKHSFKAVFWLTVLANCVGLYLVLKVFA